MSGVSILMPMQWFKALCPNLLLRLVFISFSWENPLSASELDEDIGEDKIHYRKDLINDPQIFISKFAGVRICRE